MRQPSRRVQLASAQIRRCSLHTTALPCSGTGHTHAHTHTHVSRAPAVGERQADTGRRVTCPTEVNDSYLPTARAVATLPRYSVVETATTPCPTGVRTYVYVATPAVTTPCQAGTSTLRYTHTHRSRTHLQPSPQQRVWRKAHDCSLVTLPRRPHAHSEGRSQASGVYFLAVGAVPLLSDSRVSDAGTLITTHPAPPPPRR